MSLTMHFLHFVPLQTKRLLFFFEAPLATWEKERAKMIGEKNSVKWIWINKYSIWQLTKIFYIINVIAPFRLAFEREWNRKTSTLYRVALSGSSSVCVCVCAHVSIPTAHHHSYSMWRLPANVKITRQSNNHSNEKNYSNLLWLFV